MNVKECKEKKEYVAPKMETLNMSCSPNFLLMASGEKYGEDGGKINSEKPMIIFD